MPKSTYCESDILALISFSGTLPDLLFRIESKIDIVFKPYLSWLIPKFHFGFETMSQLQIGISTYYSRMVFEFIIIWESTDLDWDLGEHPPYIVFASEKRNRKIGNQNSIQIAHTSKFSSREIGEFIFRIVNSIKSREYDC